MSRSPLDAQSQQPEEAYFAAWGELAERIRQGQSFSGRERNCCFLNTGGPRWADASSALGLDLLDDSRAVASVDWDQDGDLDLWLTNRTGPRVRYLRNDTPAGHAYLALQLRGDVRRRCPSDAIGARVELQLLDEEGRERRQVQTLVAGDGFLSQSSKQLHFGFPERWTLRQVLVRWPGSLEPETWTGLAKNGRYLLEQGQSVPAGGAAAGGAAAGGAAGDIRPTPGAMLLGAEPRNVERWPADPVSSPADTDAARLWLSQPLALPASSFEPLDVIEARGAEAARSRPGPLSSRPLLLSLWASWCQPCLQELQEWSQHADALKATGIEVLALNIDRLDPQAEAADETVRTLVARMQLPFTTGFASRELVERLESLRNEAIYRRTPLPLPVSFLVDRGGMLRVIYAGPAKVEQIVADARSLDESAVANRDRAVPFPGRWSDRFFVTNPMAIAAIFREERQYAEASRYLNQFLEKNPPPAATDLRREAVSARRRLADVYQLLGQLALDEAPAREATAGDAALAALKKSLEFHPRQLGALLELAELYRQRGQLDSAQRMLERAREVSPRDPRVFNQGGLLYLSRGDTAQAEAAFQQALREKSDYYPAANNLAWLWATSPDEARRNGQRALTMAEELVKRLGPRADLLDTLAAAQAESGNFSEAVSTARRAAEAARRGGNELLAEAIEQRLREYEQGRAARDDNRRK